MISARVGVRNPKESTLKRIIGMFAFALWDDKEKKLYLARDRAGKKPLYYFAKNSSFYFASELNAFKNIADIKLDLNESSIYQYLTFGYVPSPGTIYENIYEIMRGCLAVVNDDLSVATGIYWSLPDEKVSISFNEAVNQANELLREAVKIRLRSDVPVGCFLSGGIDSGLLTAIASQYLDHPLKTFTVSLEKTNFDEAPHAALVSKKYKTEHQIIKIDPNVRELLPRVVNAYGQPFADASAIPSYCIAQEASKFVKVVLNGEGGDELFCGYRRHLAVKMFSHLDFLENKVSNALIKTFFNMMPAPQKFRSSYAFLHRYLRGMAAPDNFERYVMWCADGFSEYEKADLYKKDISLSQSSIALLADRLSSLKNKSLYDLFMFADFRLNMHDDMLVKMDIATMAHSLEGRNPFLDQRIIEWAFRLPLEIKLKGYRTKPILRELAKRYLPAELINAPKRGFEIPIEKWLRGELKELVRDYYFSSDGILLELFRKKYLEDLLENKFRLDPARWSIRVWTLLVLAVWKELQ